MTIRTAVFGASFARAAYLPALRTVPDVELVAIASNRLESARSAAAEFGIPHAYDDWRTLLDRHPVDLVCIATPTVYHAPMALAALDAGAHVICEKPMAMDASESAQMLESAQAKGRVHLIGHELRFNPNRARIAQLIAEGRLGRIQHVNILNVSNTWGDPASRPAGDWWSDAAMGGGRLGANGSHQIDLLRFWLGEVGAVSGQLATCVPNRVDKATGAAWIATADDQVSFSAEMQSGALVSVFLSGVARHSTGNQTHIFGSEGTIRLFDNDEKLFYAPAGGDFQEMSEADPNAALPGIGKGIWNAAVVGLIGEATTAIREGRQPQRGATFADGLACQQAMDAIRVSWAERRWVRL